jgi:hypothetical protein
MKVLRNACTAPVKKSTPTKGLEIIYDIMPLHLYIECRVSEIMARIRETVQPNNWDGLGSQKGHIRLWDDCKGVITNNITQTDRIPAKIGWEKNFKVHPVLQILPTSKRGFTLELTATLMAHS